MKRSWIVCWAVVFVFGVLAVSIGQAAAANVCGAWVDGAGTVHIPEVNVDGAIYWATLQLEPGNDGAITLKLTGYGPVADNHCQNSQRTFYVASKGVPSAFIPSVEYAGAAYWWLLELVPSADGALRLKVTGRGKGGDWSGEGGAFLATMQVEVVSAQDLQMTVRGRSPLGVKAEITTTLLPNQPAASPSLTHSQPTGGTYSFRLTYTVPYSDLPPEVAGRLRAALALNATSDSKEDSAVGVAIEGALDEGGENILELIAEKALGETAAAVVEAGGNFLDVLEAWHTRKEHLEQMRELDALEECAKHPAIPYFSPEDQQRVLNELAHIRLEIKMGTASKFVNTMIGTAAGLTPPLVDVGIVGIVSYTNKIHDEINSSYLEDARKMVTCKKKWRYTGWVRDRLTINGYSGAGFEQNTQVTFEMEDQGNGVEFGRVKEGTVTSTGGSGSCCGGCSTLTIDYLLPPSYSMAADDGFLEVDLGGRTYVGTGSGPDYRVRLTTHECDGSVSSIEIPQKSAWLTNCDLLGTPFSDVRTLAGRTKCSLVPATAGDIETEWEFRRVEEE